MYRNLSRRIEVVTPILAAAAKQKLWEVLDICLRDRRQAWTLDAEAATHSLFPTPKGKALKRLARTKR